MTDITVVEGMRKTHVILLRAPVVRRLVVAFGLACVLGLGSSGCSFIGDALQQKTTLQENLRYQKLAAQKFISNWPYVEIITFTREGSFDGSGEWSANAIVTIEGKEYRQILGPWTGGGAPFPESPASFTPAPVTVNYSDGTSEVLE